MSKELSKQTYIAVSNSIEQSALNALLANPHLEVDITSLSSGRLPKRVKAGVITYGNVFDEPHVQYMENLSVLSKDHVSIKAPQLETVGNIWAYNARTRDFDVPKLVGVDSLVSDFGGPSFPKRTTFQKLKAALDR